MPSLVQVFLSPACCSPEESWGPASSGSSDTHRPRHGWREWGRAAFSTCRRHVRAAHARPTPADITLNPGDGPRAASRHPGRSPAGADVIWARERSGNRLGRLPWRLHPHGAGRRRRRGPGHRGRRGRKAVGQTVTLAHAENGRLDTTRRRSGLRWPGRRGCEGFGGALTPSWSRRSRALPGGLLALASVPLRPRRCSPWAYCHPSCNGRRKPRRVRGCLRAPQRTPRTTTTRGSSGGLRACLSERASSGNPIPKSVWEAATRTAAEVPSTSRSSSPQAASRTAPPADVQGRLAPIKGKVYYQAYNTALAHNYGASTVSGDPMEARRSR